MGRITRIEERLASLVERPFDKRNGFDPLSIEIEVKRKLEKEKKNILGIIMIPNSITIVMDEAIYNENEPFLGIFRETLLKSLHQWFKEKGYEPAHELIVKFLKGSLKRESFDVGAFYEQADGSLFSSQPPPFNPPSTLLKQESSGGLSGKSDDKLSIVRTLMNVKTNEQFEILLEETIVGRSEDCDITIKDRTVSEIHACIYVKSGNAILEDLGSRNGTRVNCEKVSKKIISDGDRITIGCIDLIFNVLYP